VCVCATCHEELEKLTEAVAMSMYSDSADDELNLDVVVEELWHEVYNQADDARCLRSM
jgi:hypothetical protein